MDDVFKIYQNYLNGNILDMYDSISEYGELRFFQDFHFYISMNDVEWVEFANLTVKYFQKKARYDIGR